MITWTPYTNPDKGAYAYHGGLTLIAEHTGAWAVFYSDGRMGSVSSQLAPTLYPPEERNIESAKAKAEAAAIKMLS